jgi:hypothetical protein
MQWLFQVVSPKILEVKAGVNACGGLDFKNSWGMG